MNTPYRLFVSVVSFRTRHPIAAVAAALGPTAVLAAGAAIWGVRVAGSALAGIALFILFAVTWTRARKQRYFRDREDIERTLGLPVLASCSAREKR